MKSPAFSPFSFRGKRAGSTQRDTSPASLETHQFHLFATCGINKHRDTTTIPIIQLIPRSQGRTCICWHCVVAAGKNEIRNLCQKLWQRKQAISWQLQMQLQHQTYTWESICGVWLGNAIATPHPGSGCALLYISISASLTPSTAHTPTPALETTLKSTPIRIIAGNCLQFASVRQIQDTRPYTRSYRASELMICFVRLGTTPVDKCVSIVRQQPPKEKCSLYICAGARLLQ